MADESRVLVVANVTSTSRELTDALKERAARGPSRFTLVVPARADERGGEAASERLDEALTRMGHEGLEVDGMVIGGSDPIAAVMAAWESDKFDEIIVSTLPPGTSGWLELGLPRRVEEQTGAPVKHVVAHGSGWATFAGTEPPAA
jgi:hypothetical protein